jgi:negative regulator of sigma E activity
MSDDQKLKETLSALFDNEAGKADQLELRRLARALENNTDLIETYQRYTLTRAVLKGESVQVPATRFVDRIRTALEKENMDSAPAITLPAQKPDLKWWQAAGRVAVAASVAVVVVYFAQPQFTAQSTVTAPAVPAVTVTQTDPNNRVLSPPVMTVSAGDGRSFQSVPEAHAAFPAVCVLSPLRADSNSLVWEKKLPVGYVLCKQDAQTGQCVSLASKIGCYLD